MWGGGLPRHVLPPQCGTVHALTDPLPPMGRLPSPASSRNECLAASSPCSANANCTNMLGSYRCTCNPGYWSPLGDGVCVDLNECAFGLHQCDPHALCSNTVGAYTCACVEGYEGSGRACKPLSLCTAEACKNGGTCHDDESAPSRTRCDCPARYTGVDCGDHVCAACVDVSPCANAYTGECVGFVEGTGVCPAQTTQCEAVVEVDECTCLAGEGDCVNANGDCFAVAEPGTTQCGDGQTFCGVASLETLSTDGDAALMTIELATSAGAMDDDAKAAVLAAVAEATGLDASTLSLVSVASVTGEGTVMLGVLANGATQDDAVALSASASSGHFQSMLKKQGMADVSVGRLTAEVQSTSAAVEAAASHTVLETRFSTSGRAGGATVGDVAWGVVASLGLVVAGATIWALLHAKAITAATAAAGGGAAAGAGATAGPTGTARGHNVRPSRNMRPLSGVAQPRPNPLSQPAPTTTGGGRPGPPRTRPPPPRRGAPV